MSIPVAMAELRAAVDARGSRAYVLTVSDDGAPRVVHAPLRWDGDALVVEVGARTAANARARPAVSLLFPVRSDGDYSLIVDGTATVGSRELRVMPTRAVLHRPAAAPDPSASCGADCVPLLPPSSKPS
jgi:hypothetical protein